MSVNGLVVMTPTSIASTGTSASIGANGKVSFTGVSNLELRGVFTSAYDNYMVVMRWQAISGLTTIRNRFMSGTTPATGANYVLQELAASSTTVSAARYTGETSAVMGVGQTTQRNGYTTFFFGPYLAQPTAQRNVGIYSSSDATIYDDVCTHSLSTSYDGLNIFPFANTMTGEVTVYGFNQ